MSVCFPTKTEGRFAASTQIANMGSNPPFVPSIDLWSLPDGRRQATRAHAAVGGNFVFADDQSVLKHMALIENSRPKRHANPAEYLEHSFAFVTFTNTPQSIKCIFRERVNMRQKKLA